MKKPTGWGAGGRVVLFMVEVARVELASKYVKYSATTGLVGCCTLRSALLAHSLAQNLDVPRKSFTIGFGNRRIHYL